jgi:hypothetical protein
MMPDLTESQLEWCRENIKTPAHPNLFREMEVIANANRIERNLGEQPHDDKAGSLDRNNPWLNSNRAPDLWGSHVYNRY